MSRGRIDSPEILKGIQNLESSAVDQILNISRKGKAPIQIHLSMTHCPYENSACTICIVTDPKNTDTVNIHAIALAFQLSPTEQKITEHVIKGHSNNTIAEERCCSSETVKSHVKSIYDKTGCKSRVDLVNTAHKLSPPIESAEPLA